MRTQARELQLLRRLWRRAARVDLAEIIQRLLDLARRHRIDERQFGTRYSAVRAAAGSLP